MQNRAFAPALGASISVAAGVPSYASAADPSGIWAKDDGSAKMEVKKCGRGICSKIVWLKNPEDSRGRPLRDARNENTSMRRPADHRPALVRQHGGNRFEYLARQRLQSRRGKDLYRRQGDARFPQPDRAQGLQGVAALRREILDTVQASAVSGEARGTRANQDEEPVVPEEPAPKAMLKPAPVIEAAREPVSEAKPGAMAPLTVGTPPAAAPVQARVSVAPKKMVKSTSPDSALKHNHLGLGLVTTSTSPDPLPLSGDNVSSLIVMTNPDVWTQVRKPEVAETNAHSGPVEGNKAASALAAKPKAKPKTQSAEAPA